MPIGIQKFLPMDLLLQNALEVKIRNLGHKKYVGAFRKSVLFPKDFPLDQSARERKRWKYDRRNTIVYNRRSNLDGTAFHSKFAA